MCLLRAIMKVLVTTPQCFSITQVSLYSISLCNSVPGKCCYWFNVRLLSHDLQLPFMVDHVASQCANRATTTVLLRNIHCLYSSGGESSFRDNNGYYYMSLCLRWFLHKHVWSSRLIMSYGVHCVSHIMGSVLTEESSVCTQ